jgi:hypothetical protein
MYMSTELEFKVQHYNVVNQPKPEPAAAAEIDPMTSDVK